MVAGVLALGVFILVICTLVENPLYNITFLAQYEGDVVGFLHGIANFAGGENLSALAKAFTADNADMEQITQSEQYQRIDDFLKSFLRSQNPGRTADGMFTDCQILIFDHLPEVTELPFDWRENATVLFDVRFFCQLVRKGMGQKVGPSAGSCRNNDLHGSGRPVCLSMYAEGRAGKCFQCCKSESHDFL